MMYALKFSQKKKAKMRKTNQRRINRECKHMIGCTLDYELKAEVIDQAKINGVMYLLTENMYNQYAIYKIINVHNSIKLSPRRILQNQKNFMNHAYWSEHSTILINEYGDIEDVKRGSIFGPYNQKTPKFSGSFVIIVD